MTTIVLADDHNIVRQGLRALLEVEKDLTVVGEAGDEEGLDGGVGGLGLVGERHRGERGGGGQDGEDCAVHGDMVPRSVGSKLATDGHG